MNANHRNEEKDMTNDAPIRVFSVDDHPLFREGIAAIINSQSDMFVAGAATNGNEAIERFRDVKPDVMLLDLQLPDLNGIEVLIAIRNEFPDARIIILTTFEKDVEIQRALKAGAQGYMLKASPPKQMLETIRQVHRGKKSVSPELAAKLAEHIADEALSDREVEVLRHVAEGDRNRDIAQRLFIAEETVKVHLRHIMGKLGATDRTHSVAIAARRGIIYL
jgi:DNA-binding NarL/FixJ family response regulator